VHASGDVMVLEVACVYHPIISHLRIVHVHIHLPPRVMPSIIAGTSTLGRILLRITFPPYLVGNHRNGLEVLVEVL
jgi:hypothetical protein